MKTNIKMRVTPEQSTKIQEICFENGVGWGVYNKTYKIENVEKPFFYIGSKLGLCWNDNEEEYSSDSFKEIDADLFIRTNGTCEENTFNELFEKVSERVNDFQIANKFEPSDKDNNSIDYETLRISHLVLNSKYEELEEKLKKKNEILKKARIKRKNQREELHKLNLKLQKRISLEEHDSKMKIVLNEKHKLELENIEMGKLVNLNRSALGLMGATKDLSILRVEEQNKEIEKLKAVIEYLESKVK